MRTGFALTILAVACMSSAYAQESAKTLVSKLDAEYKTDPGIVTTRRRSRHCLPQMRSFCRPARLWGPATKL